MIVCTEAETSDASEIDALAHSAGLSVDAAQSLALPQALVSVARRPGQPRLLGFAIAWRVGDELEVMDLATHHAARRRGIGSALVEHLCDRSRELKLEALLLEVRSKNLPAIRLYQKHGFRVVLERQNYYREPPDNALCMRLSLRPGR